MKEGRKPEYPVKSPLDELQKCHILNPEEFKPQPRLELEQ